MEDNKILCVSNAELKQYYFNPKFSSLPDQIQKEIITLCVDHTAENGGIFSLEFNSEGKLQISVKCSDENTFFDQIGSELKIKQMQQEKVELFRSLELFYQVFIRSKYS
ncbi:hypothetical protein FACS189418_7210 [Clostridia bacterium]|nr:hypothetical protein FACS189418_7210 [Clostridia bacterium]